MERLTAYPWPGNLRELSHTVRTMTLFCDGPVILPEHVVFSPDLASLQPKTDGADADPNSASDNNEPASHDLTLASAVGRHVSFVYEQTARNQRRAAKLLWNFAGNAGATPPEVAPKMIRPWPRIDSDLYPRSSIEKTR